MLLAGYLIKPFTHEKVAGGGGVVQGGGGVVQGDSPSRTVPWRYAKGRVDVLYLYLQNIDINDIALPLSSVMKVGTQ